MARDTITPVTLTRDTAANAAAATVLIPIVVANGAQIDCSNIDADKLLIHVTNTHGTAHNVTIPAGVYSRASLGNLVFQVAATSGENMVVVESARFKQADNMIYIDFVTDHAGRVGAYLLP